MVKVEKIKLDPRTMTAVADLVADSQSDVQPGMQVEGLPQGYTLGMGSSVFTMDQDIAFLDSNGTWIWG